MSAFDPNKFSCVTDRFGEDWCACARSDEKCTCVFTPSATLESGAVCGRCGIEVADEINIPEWN